MHTCLHAYTRTCIRAYLHTCICAQMHTDRQTDAQANKHANVHMYNRIHACTRTRTCTTWHSMSRCSTVHRSIALHRIAWTWHDTPVTWMYYVDLHVLMRATVRYNRYRTDIATHRITSTRMVWRWVISSYTRSQYRIASHAHMTSKRELQIWIVERVSGFHMGIWLQFYQL